MVFWLIVLSPCRVGVGDTLTARSCRVPLALASRTAGRTLRAIPLRFVCGSTRTPPTALLLTRGKTVPSNFVAPSFSLPCWWCWQSLLARCVVVGQACSAETPLPSEQPVPGFHRVHEPCPQRAAGTRRDPARSPRFAADGADQRAVGGEDVVDHVHDPSSCLPGRTVRP